MCDLQGPSGQVQQAAIADIHLLVYAEYIASLLPNVRAFWRECKYINDVSFMPDLNCANSGQNREKSNINSNALMHVYNLRLWKTIDKKINYFDYD